MLTAPHDAAQTAALTEALAADTGVNQHLIYIGARSYVIKPLTAARMGMLGTLVLRETQEALKTGITDFADVQLGDLKELSSVIDALVIFWDRLPETFGKAMALMLSAEAADDRAYLIEHLTAAHVLAIVEGFMDANHWEDLAEGFFRIRTRWNTVVARFRPEPSSSIS